MICEWQTVMCMEHCVPMRMRRKRKKRVEAVMSLLIQACRKTIDIWDSSILISSMIYPFLYLLFTTTSCHWHFDIYVIHFDFDDLMINMVSRSWAIWISYHICVSLWFVNDKMCIVYWFLLIIWQFLLNICKCSSF